MTNATRYLCAAAYLSVDYANRVLGELISSHRAVAPSVGVDLLPIIRHCLRARKINLVRDLILSGLLLIGLVVAPPQTLFGLLIAFFIGFLPGVNWARKSLGTKIVAVLGSIFLFSLAMFILFIVIVASIIKGITNDISQGSFGGGSTASSGVGVLLPALVVAIAVVATQLIYVYVRNRTLCDELASGAKPRNFSTQAPAVEARIAQVEAAQRGNLLLYAGADPFVGTGWVSRTWSIPIELHRATDRKRGTAWMQQRSRSGGHDYAPVDPVELHSVLRERLLSLKDEQLPPNERLSGPEVHEHASVAAYG